MAFNSAMLQNNLIHFNPRSSCCLKPSFQFREMPLRDSDFNIQRRLGAVAAICVVLFAKESISAKLANAFDFQLVAPDQTLEEAESGIKGHAQRILQVKDMIEAESWKEVQIALRRSSPALKQDIYTIIQQKPGNERPLLRKLYSDLFNNVSRLDYAARDKDASLVRQCYESIVLVLNEVLSRL